MNTRTFWNDLHTDLAAMPPRRRRFVIGSAVGGTLLLFLILGTAVSLWQVSRRFPESPFPQPSRLYGRATELAPGAAISAADLVAELEAQGYRRLAEAGPLAPGTYVQGEDGVVAAHLRRFPTPDGMAGGEVVEVSFGEKGKRIAGVWLAGRETSRTHLEPPQLASYFGPEMAERRPVALAELPKDVIRAVLAAEDASFFQHAGVSVPAIVRALWVDLRGGETRQGGSTITQQLVKNVYLTPERTLARKAKEAAIAMMIEMRHGKRDILEAYLNEIYWGQSGSANLIGIGAAARAYFGKDAVDLTVPEAATLAGMICAPGDFSPIEHPEKARQRRDWVLARMAKLGWLSAERAAQLAERPLATSPQPVVVRPIAPHFADAAAAEAAARFEVDDLADSGYLLFSTLSWRDQKKAEEAVAKELAATEARWKEGKRRAGEPLEASLLSVDPRDGAILAYVGGRNFERSQFDRVAQARRQAGSAFKPVIYAAAFSQGVASPATLLRDSPVVVRVGNKGWTPQNYDRSFHGVVTARTALEQSLNVPAVRLAFQVGLSDVAALARKMGFDGELEVVPALSLGTVEVSPRELTTAYATLASGGLRPELHALTAVLDAHGEAVRGEELPAPRRVLPADTAYLVTSILQGVLDRGTGYGARGQGVKDALAGKTGTTDDRRDSWFVGYSPDRATVVWVGYDDNSHTRLSGARAALPIWSRFTQGVRPAGGYPDFVPPRGVVREAIDPATGRLATPECPQTINEVFAEGEAPVEPCPLHGLESRYQMASFDAMEMPSVYERATMANGYGDRFGRLVPERERWLEEEEPAPRPANQGEILIRRHRPAEPEAPQRFVQPVPAPTPATEEYLLTEPPVSSEPGPAGEPSGR